MDNKYYLDTSIWLDYYEKRGKNGELAFKLIKQIIENDFIIVYSDLHIKELKNLGYTLDNVHYILKIVKPNNNILAHINKDQIKLARDIGTKRRLPFRDVLHAIIARDNEALLIYTDKHFEKLKDIVACKRLNELF